MGINMTIDILSDLHLDFYFSSVEVPSLDEIKEVFNPIFYGASERILGDVLILAGDIGHHNHQNLQLLQILQAEYYRHIICVLGNHDYYLVDYKSIDKYENNSFNRANEMRELINKQNNMYCLDGTVIEIDGVKFGGCDSSYNNAYLQKYFPLHDDDSLINAMWKNGVNDYRMMGNVNSYMEIYNIEIDKLKKIYDKCDVMITHVNPSYLHEHISPNYCNDKFNTFFTFDGHEFMKEGKMKYWIFGHTHDKINYQYEGVECVCNPLGYPHEHKSKNTHIKSIEIEKII